MARKDKTSICFLMSTPFTLNVFLVDHLNALSDDFDVTVCVNLRYYPITNRLNKNIKIINYTINRKISFIRDLITLFELYAIFKSNAFDAVHCITPKANLLGNIMAFLFRIPHRTISFSGQVWATKQGVGRFILKTVDRISVALATHYVSDSQSQIDFLRSEGVLTGQHVEVFGKGSIAGVDLSRFKPDLAVREQMRRAVGDDQNDFLFLFVGRITREKGIFDALTAFAAVRAVHPAAKLWLVGPDEDGLLAARAKQGETLPDGVRWLGQTETPEAYMQAADVLVLPSYRESFGVVIIEASACAVPSVAYDIVGVKDAIDQNITGIMVKLFDVEALKAAMLSLIENVDGREALKKAGLERVQAHFSAKEITRHWVQYYKTMFPQGDGSPSA